MGRRAREFWVAESSTRANPDTWRASRDPVERAQRATRPGADFSHSEKSPFGGRPPPFGVGVGAAISGISGRGKFDAGQSGYVESPKRLNRARKLRGEAWVRLFSLRKSHLLAAGRRPLGWERGLRARKWSYPQRPRQGGNDLYAYAKPPVPSTRCSHVNNNMTLTRPHVHVQPRRGAAPGDYTCEISPPTARALGVAVRFLLQPARGS